MNIIDGKVLAQEKRAALKKRVAAMSSAPSLAVILVGNDPASQLYVSLKKKAAKEVGVDVHTYLMDAETPAENIKEVIAFLNADADVDGILVQLPLPAHLDADDIVATVDPAKDVDGFHPENRAKFFADDLSGVYPVFPAAIMTLIDACDADLTGKKAVVLGRSDVFDDVMTHALVRRGCDTQFVCCTCKERFTPEEERAIADADIVVTAIGVPEMVCGDIIKDGAIVIDGGISKIGESTVGDVANYTCAKRNIFLSPVPGGVGPMTIACLLENVVYLHHKNQQ